MPQLRWILVPTWLYFGVVLGAKMVSSWVQMVQKLKLKNNHKKDDLLNAFKIDFGPQKGGEGGPGGGEGGPFGGRGRSLVGVLVLRVCLLRPRWPQELSRDLPRVFFLDFGPHLGGFCSQT